MATFKLTCASEYFSSLSVKDTSNFLVQSELMCLSYSYDPVSWTSWKSCRVYEEVAPFSEDGGAHVSQAIFYVMYVWV